MNEYSFSDSYTSSTTMYYFVIFDVADYSEGNKKVIVVLVCFISNFLPKIS